MSLPKILVACFYDILKKNYTYHSGALTYQFLLAIAPLSIVIFNLLSFLPFIDVDRITDFVDNFLPQYTNKVIHEIITLQSHGKQASIIAIALSYFFSVGFVKNLSNALAFVSENTLGRKRELIYWAVMPVLLLILTLIVVIVFFISIFVRLLIPSEYSILAWLLYLLLVMLVLLLLYTVFLNKRVRVKHLIFSSFVSALFIFMSQFLFSWYVSNVFKGSLIYGSLSTVIAFLIWSNLNFLIIILGARLIYRLETS